MLSLGGRGRNPPTPPKKTRKRMLPSPSFLSATHRGRAPLAPARRDHLGHLQGPLGPARWEAQRETRDPGLQQLPGGSESGPGRPGSRAAGAWRLLPGPQSPGQAGAHSPRAADSPPRALSELVPGWRPVHLRAVSQHLKAGSRPFPLQPGLAARRPGRPR